MKHDLDAQWHISHDGETWGQACYSTKDEAIASGIAYLIDGCGFSHFYVGQAVPVKVPIDIDILLDTARDAVWVMGFPMSETYLADFTKEDREELEDVIQNWFEQKGYAPKWREVINIEKRDKPWR